MSSVKEFTTEKIVHLRIVIRCSVGTVDCAVVVGAVVVVVVELQCDGGRQLRDVEKGSEGFVFQYSLLFA
jgi:hypothetical protein